MTHDIVDGKRQAVIGLAVWAALAAFYLVTAPDNHATALDSYGFAFWITEYPLSAVPELRLFLWIVAMHVIYDMVTAVLPVSDTFAILGTANAIQMSMAVVLLQRLLSQRLGVASDASWITAAAFAFSYGIWRYAAELEVYASAALISMALCHAAFSLETGDGLRRSGRIAALAVFGGLATLAYQPLGILAGIAIPCYLAIRLGLPKLALYLIVSGGVVLSGLVLAFLLDGASSGPGVGAVFDTDGKPLVIPSAVEAAEAAVAFLQNILSINWGFAFEPTRQFLETNGGGIHRAFLYSASFAGPGYLVFFVTLPLAGILVFLAIVLSLRSRSGSLPLAPRLAVLIWLTGQALMVLLIDPGGIEAWLPSLFPLFILIGTSVAEPLSRAGRSLVGAALVAVFVVHNHFAGIGVLASGEEDFYQMRAGPVIRVSGPGDLLVVLHDWSFDRYLSLTAEARNIDAATLPAHEVRETIAQTLAEGKKVFLFDDWSSKPSPMPAVIDPEHPTIQQLLNPYPGRFDQLDLGEGGLAYVLRPNGL